MPRKKLVPLTPKLLEAVWQHAHANERDDCSTTWQVTLAQMGDNPVAKRAVRAYLRKYPHLEEEA